MMERWMNGHNFLSSIGGSPLCIPRHETLIGIGTAPTEVVTSRSRQDDAQCFPLVFGIPESSPSSVLRTVVLHEFCYATYSLPCCIGSTRLHQN